MKKLLLFIQLFYFLQAFSQGVDLFDETVINKIKRKLSADSIIPDPYNEDGVYNARNKKTKKWGMYQNFKEFIPARYDSIDFFGFNHPFTLVWNNGKVGVILDGSDGYKESVPCIYDDGQIWKYWNREIAQEEKVLKVRKGEKWGMINWITGDIQVDFICDNPNDVKMPYKKSH
jgi:hypothetical protein